jgi:hypothetical protein
MKFWVLFKDGINDGLTYSQDLVTSKPFEDFIKQHDELTPSLYNTQEWSKVVKGLKHVGIVNVEPGMMVYINLRAWGAG